MTYYKAHVITDVMTITFGDDYPLDPQGVMAIWNTWGNIPSFCSIKLEYSR